MKLFNTEFSVEGKNRFEGLTRTKQKEWLKERNPLITMPEIEKALKGIKYGKPKRTKKKTKES